MEGFTFKTKFIRQLFAYLHVFAIRMYNADLDNRIESLSLVRDLETKKERLFEEFQEDCRVVDFDERFAKSVFHQVVLVHVSQRILQNLGTSIYSDLPEEEFKYKSAIHFRIHKELLSMNTKDVLLYSENYKKFVEQWVSAKAKKHLDEGDRLLNIVKERALAALDEVHRAIDKLTTEDKPYVWLEKILKDFEINQVRKYYIFLFIYLLINFLGLQYGESTKCPGFENGNFKHPGKY